MEKLLTVLEAAEVLGGFSASTVRFWVRQGRLAHTRLGRRLMFTSADLETFIRSGRVEGAYPRTYSARRNDAGVGDQP